MKRPKTTISQLACLGTLVVLVYPLYTVCRSLGFDHCHSRSVMVAFAIAFVGVFLGASYWLESRRARKRIQNREKTFEELSLEEKLERFEKRGTPFDLYIEERIRQGDLTREQVEEMVAEARSSQHSPETARQKREEARKKLNRLLWIAVLCLLMMMIYYIL